VGKRRNSLNLRKSHKKAIEDVKAIEAVEAVEAIKHLKHLKPLKPSSRIVPESLSFCQLADVWRTKSLVRKKTFSLSPRDSQ
jgi:hypothetical protein